jgi:hypothetical protein
MNVKNLTDHQLLIAIAEVNAELGEDAPASDAEAWSAALNAEGERRWGANEMDALAELVTGSRMDGDDFVAWARQAGQAWLDGTR